MPNLDKSDPRSKAVRAELVEALSLSFSALQKEGQPFDIDPLGDKANGGGLESLQLGINQRCGAGSCRTFAVPEPASLQKP
jgi:hypothetical protein